MEKKSDIAPESISHISTEIEIKKILVLLKELSDTISHYENTLEKLLEIPKQETGEEEIIQNSDIPAPWVSSQKIEDVLNQHNPRVLQIKNSKSIPGHHQDTLSRLRSTGFGRIYRQYLKYIPIIHGFVQWIWRNGYPVYIGFSARLSNWQDTKWRPLVKMHTFAKEHDTPTILLAKSSLTQTPVPITFPSCEQNYLVAPHEHYEFPDVYISIINDALVYGGSNLICTQEEVLCHDLYDFKQDYTSEELHGRTTIDPKKERIRWLLHDKSPEPIPVAATFLDACAPNYAHWMTEVLPRIALFCAEEKFKKIPLAVNEGLHENIMESLFLLAGSDREIITVPIGRALAVNKLYVTSVAGYVPFERRNNKLTSHSHGLFCPPAFKTICSTLNFKLEEKNSRDYPKRFFLRRTSGGRRLSNSHAIEKHLATMGFSIVEPEKLTFLQQVILFSKAEIIVAPTGAGLANLIFCPSSATIVILIAKHPDTSYWYWQNMACASGKTVNYVLGEITEGKHYGIHADYAVDIEILTQFLRDNEKKHDTASLD